MRPKIKYLSGFFIMLWLLSCGSQRKNPIAKTYHNTTSYFNWYYNGELVWREGVREIQTKFKVPAEGFIELQYFGDESSAKGSYPKFDESIKKAEVVIFKHPNGKWIDDCRFLIGRNWFYKKNYYLAAQNFEHIISKYPKSKIIPDVYLWLARTYFILDRETSGDKIVAEKLKKVKLKKRQRGELAMMQADSYVKTEQHARALKTIEKNLKNIKGRLNRARTHFLLGQLYSHEGKYAKGYASFRKVTKINTDYELIFNAKLKGVRLLVLQQEGADETQKIFRALKRMLRDEKNLEYRDQLFYELALLELKKNDYDNAVKHLEQSVAASTSNQRQKALSYFLAGKIYFYNLINYDRAQAYFDSASTQISKKDPEYYEIATIGTALNDYVGFKKTIHYQDSLLFLSNLSKSELDRRVDAVIDEEKRQKEVAEQEMMSAINTFSDPNLADPFAPKSSSGFYFENPSSVAAGRLEFQRVWGNRKNEDDWRRKNKQATFESDEQEEEKEAVDSVLVKEFGKKYKYYKDIPRSEEEKEWARTKIKDALFGLGQVFDKKLSQPDSAIVVYNKLIDRFPKSEQALKARFALYHIYSKRDPYLADDYKDYICKNHPGSIYCKLLKNEDISEQLYAEAKELSSAYNALYMTFKSQDYSTVISFSEFLLTQFKEGKEIPQVLYIRGLSFAETKNRDSLRAVFTVLINSFPKADVTPIAIRTLELLDGKVGTSSQNLTPKDEAQDKTANSNNTDNPKFKDFEKDPKPNERFFVVFMVDKSAITNSDLKIKFSEFNEAFFKTERLNVSVFFYQNQQHLAYISQFRTISEATDYIKMAKEDSKFKSLTSTPGFQAVFITPTNFRVAYGTLRFADYYEFYNQVILPSVSK